MKKYPYIGIFALVLVAASLCLLLDPSGSTLAPRDRLFRLDAPDRIMKVVLEDRHTVLILDKSQQGWKVNDRFPANSGMVESLLGGLARMRIAGTVSRMHLDKLNDHLDTAGISIKLYGQKRKHADFRMAAMNDQYLLRNNRSSRPVIAEIIGNRTGQGLDISTESYRWREKILIQYPPGGIASVKVYYMQDSLDSFRVFYDPPSGWKTQTLNSQNVGDTDQQKAILFVSYFSIIRLEEFLYGFDPGTLEKGMLFCTIEITGTDGRINLLRLYRKKIQGEGVNAFDPYRLYCIKEGEEMPMLVRYLDIDPVLKTPGYFAPD